ncbi:P27 family phage terminase small subunit [Gracilibacillus sp. HCP3S3_G5_1]|uniref:P27 family phage terminase small subunit n=1 Tax=unclassified Gracilibacillus TaxID=2625209 RepID=UPI003F89BD74
MARKKKTIENNIVKEMKSLGTYKTEYNKMIKIFAGMIHQYEVFEEQFEESNYKITEQHTNKAGAVNERKVPLYTAIESLRKDIATYSDRLCLNPKSLESVKVEKEGTSKLAKALSQIEQ